MTTKKATKKKTTETSYLDGRLKQWDDAVARLKEGEYIAFLASFSGRAQVRLDEDGFYQCLTGAESSVIASRKKQKKSTKRGD